MFSEPKKTLASCVSLHHIAPNLFPPPTARLALLHFFKQFQECDFEGHHLPSSSSASTFSGDHYQLVIDGLEDVGHAPQDLVTTAHFSVDSSYKVGRRASPIRVSTPLYVWSVCMFAFG